MAAASPDGATRPARALAVVNFLRAHGGDAGLARLQQAPFCLKLRRHAAHPSLVLLHYDQVRSKAAEAIVRECRGIVLDEAAGFAPVCVPYFKFDNYSEGSHEMDWHTATVHPKLDGSLVSLYYYAGAWQVATSGMPDAAGPVSRDRNMTAPPDPGPDPAEQLGDGNGSGGNSCGSGASSSDAPSLTFADLFWGAWHACGCPEPSTLPTHLCYMFELLTPQNRVVVPITCERVVLHGVRDMRSLVEVSPETTATQLGLACAPTLPFASMEAVVEAARALSPSRAEGFIVRYGDWQRVKVKSPAYVLTALLPRGAGGLAKARLKRGDKSDERLLQIAALGEGAEFCAAFPALRAALADVSAALDAVLDDADATYAAATAGMPRGLVGAEAARYMARALPPHVARAHWLARSGAVPDVRTGVRGMPTRRLAQLVWARRASPQGAGGYVIVTQTKSAGAASPAQPCFQSDCDEHSIAKSRA